MLDAQTIEDLMLGKRKDISTEEIEKQITARIASSPTTPSSSNWASVSTPCARSTPTSSNPARVLRELLELARDTVAAEKAVNEVPRESKARPH